MPFCWKDSRWRLAGAWAEIQPHKNSNMHECSSALSIEKAVGGKKLIPKEIASVVCLAARFLSIKKRTF